MQTFFSLSIRRILNFEPTGFKVLKKRKGRHKPSFFRYFCISISNFPSEFTLSRKVLTYRLQKFSISFMVAVTLVASYILWVRSRGFSPTSEGKCFSSSANRTARFISSVPAVQKSSMAQ